MEPITGPFKFDNIDELYNELDEDFTAASLHNIAMKKMSENVKDTFMLTEENRKRRQAIIKDFTKQTIDAVQRITLSAAKEGYISKMITISNIPNKLSLSETNDVVSDILRVYIKKGFNITIDSVMRRDITYALHIKISWDLDYI